MTSISFTHTGTSTRPAVRGSLQRAFLRLAIFALRHSGRGYLEAFRSTVASTRFFDDTPSSNELFVQLADSISEMPAIAHLAVRGALADPSPEVVRAGQALLQIYPDLDA